MMAAVVALALLSSAQGQMPDKYKQDYQEAQKYQNNPQAAQAMEKKYLPGGKKPKTCSDECDMIEKVMDDNCDKVGKKKPGADKNCKVRMADMVKTCRGSCAEKGKIDPKYMKDHLKKPKAPPHTGPPVKNEGGGFGPSPSNFGSSDE